MYNSIIVMKKGEDAMKIIRNALVVVLASLVLTGCGAYGEPLLLSAFYDRNDPCQGITEQRARELNRPAGYRAPEWCGAARPTQAYIRDFRTNGIVATVNTR